MGISVSHFNVFEDVPLVEFMHLVFTHMPGESYHTGDSCQVFVVVLM